MSDTLDVNALANIEIPEMLQAIADSDKPAPPPIQPGSYLAVITSAEVHIGQKKPDRDGPSYNYKWGLAVNRATRAEKLSDLDDWTTPADIFDLRQHYTFVGYVVDGGIQLHKSLGFPEDTAKFMAAAGADSNRFEPEKYLGRVIRVTIAHEESNRTNDAGEPYVNAVVTAVRPFVGFDGNPVKLEQYITSEAPESVDLVNDEGKPANPFA